MTSPNTAPRHAVSPMEAARQALEAPSTTAVLWRHGEGGPTTTVLITEPGAVISADFFRHRPVIITNELGEQSVTDFGVAVNLPGYNGTTGRFGNGSEPCIAYDVHDNPNVGNDIVIGAPLYGNGPAIVRATLDGGDASEVRGVNPDAMDRLEPSQEFDLPNPMVDAAAFVDRAQRHFDTVRATNHV